MEFFDKPSGADASVSVDVSPSSEGKDVHFASPNSSSSTNTAQQSPYADNTVEWSLPPFGAGKQLEGIPEETGTMPSWGSHMSRPSFGSTTEDEDPSPFNTRVHVSILLASK